MKTTAASLSFFVLVFTISLGCLSGCSVSSDKDIPLTTSSDKALQHFLEGRVLSESLRNAEAQRHFERAVKADPDFALARLYLAFTDPTAKGFFENLQLAKSLSHRASDGERIIIDATEAAANGDPARQRGLFLKLVELYPEDVRANMFLANSYFGQQEYDLAIKQYEGIVEVAPDYAPPYNMLGYCYRSIDNYEAAASAFETYTKLIPDDPNPYDSYAELLTRMGKFESAITHYRKALEVESTFGPPHIGISANLIFLGRYEDARTELQAYFDNAVNSAQQRAALIGMAVTYADEGELDSAIGWIRRQFELSEALPDAATMSQDLTNMAFLQLVAHRPDEAQESLNRSLRVIEESDLFERVKRNARLDSLLGRVLVLLEKGELAEAKPIAETYLERAEPLMNPFRIRNAHFALGRIAVAEKDWDKAIVELELADQQQAWTIYHLATAYEGKGDLATARDLYRRAAEMYHLNNLTYAAIRLKAAKRAADLESRLSS